MKMKSFWRLFKKVGGKEVLRQYRDANVLLYAFLATALLGISRKSLEIVRLAVNNRILGKLRKKYRKYIQNYLKTIKNDKLENNKSNIVWICWLQGIENSPKVVQRCYQSMRENLKDKEIIVITEDNYMNYISFPNHIQKKYESGVITKTHFSDLLRLELLIKYGGTWMDATVLCTGINIPKYILDSDLFVYQNLKPGLDGQCRAISSWLMTACTNHPILLLTRALLYEYWNKNNSMKDYFLLHDMFQLAIETYPEEWSKVIPCSNSVPHILLLRLFEEYEDEVFKAVTEMTCFHKMSYKFSEEKVSKMGTFYSKLFGNEM